MKDICFMIYAIVVGQFDPLKWLAPGRHSISKHIYRGTLRLYMFHPRTGLKGECPNGFKKKYFCFVMKCVFVVGPFDPLEWLDPG